MPRRKEFQVGYKTRTFGPYQMTWWSHHSRLLISKLPACSSEDVQQIDVIGMPEVLELRDELKSLQCTVQGLSMIDYLDKLFCLHPHDVAYISVGS